MKNKIKLLVVFLMPVLLFIGCQDRSELTAPTPTNPVSGTADFTRYVALGNSLTAGYQSSALYQSSQVYSFGNMIAQQVNTSFAQPFISDPGIGGQIKIVSLDPFVTKQEASDAGQPLNLTYAAPYNNLGIPGIVLADVMGSTTTSGSYSKSPFIDIILRGQGTAFAQAKLLQPTLITLWIGNNDVLGFATSGGSKPTAPTDANTFAYLYNQLVDSLVAFASQPKIVVANIPNVTAIPFFTTVGPLVAQKLSANSIPAMYYAKHGAFTAGQTDVVTPSQLASYSVLFTLIGQTYASYIGTPSGKFYRDYNIPAALVGVDTTQPFGLSPLNPWPDALTLDASEISTAATATTNFNNAISAAVAAHSSQVALLDVNSFFNTIRANDASGGTSYNGIKFTTTFVTGGLFSLDGVHPTSQGYAIIANEFLKKINEKFGSSYPLIDVSTIPGSLMFAKTASIDLLAKGSFYDPMMLKTLLF